MRKHLCLASAVALLTVNVTLPAAHAGESRPDNQMLASPGIPPKAPREIPDDVKAAWGCVVGGSVGTTAALLAGSENLINVVAGGLVAPANRLVLMVGLAGVVFTTFCTLGQQLTPLYVYYTTPSKAEAEHAITGLPSYTTGQLPQAIE